MDGFEMIGAMGHEQVVFCNDQSAGLRAIIAIHDTTLGPALGGCRVLPYASTQAALTDVLHALRAMTYKAALAGLDLGGGKCVVIADPQDRSEALFRALGRHIESLGGRYVTAEDMNTSFREMGWVKKETKHVSGIDPLDGGSGDPGPVTAWGVFHGMRAAVEHGLGKKSFDGVRIAVQGVGSVGWDLSRYLSEAGARLAFSDINKDKAAAAADAFGGDVIEGDFAAADVDVLAPCAIGGVIGAHNVASIRAKVVCGAANNVLRDEAHDGDVLRKAGIVCAPDFVVNAGGIVSVYGEIANYQNDRAMKTTEGIYDTTRRVLLRADADDVAPMTAAVRMATERVEAIRALRLR